MKNDTERFGGLIVSKRMKRFRQSGGERIQSRSSVWLSAWFLCVTFLFLCLAPGCAVFDRRNTILVNAVEENMVPENQPSRALMAPIYIPVGLMAGVLDAFIVHPIRMLPRAAEDTSDALWEFSDETGYVTHAGSVVYRAGFSPIFFSLVWLARSAFIGFDDDPVAPGERPEGSYEDLLERRDVQGLRYDLARCDDKTIAVDLLIRTFDEFEDQSLEPGENRFYDSPAFLAVRCLESRDSESVFAFFQARLLAPESAELTWVHDQSIQYFQRHNSPRAARVLMKALIVPGRSREFKMAILRGAIFMNNSDAQQVILDSLSDKSR